MEMVLQSPKPEEKIEVHNTDIVSRVFEPNIDKNKINAVSKSNSECSPVVCRKQQLDHNGLIKHTLQTHNWVDRKTIKTQQQLNDLKSKKTRQWYTDVLNREETFVKNEVDDQLKTKEMLNLRRKELLHKKWSEEVYKPIQSQVKSEINGPLYRELSRRKKQLFKEYLDHVNKKGHVFLDTMSPGEYYPLSLQPVKTAFHDRRGRALRDPLHSQQRERSAGDRVVFQCLTGSRLTDRDLHQIQHPDLPLSRQATECGAWLRMCITDIESPLRLASRRKIRCESSQNQSCFELWSDGYSLPTSGLPHRRAKPCGVSTSPYTALSPALAYHSLRPKPSPAIKV